MYEYLLAGIINFEYRENNLLELNNLSRKDTMAYNGNSSYFESNGSSCKKLYLLTNLA